MTQKNKAAFSLLVLLPFLAPGLAMSEGAGGAAGTGSAGSAASGAATGSGVGTTGAGTTGVGATGSPAGQPAGTYNNSATMGTDINGMPKGTTVAPGTNSNATPARGNGHQTHRHRNSNGINDRTTSGTSVTNPNGTANGVNNTGNAAPLQGTPAPVTPVPGTPAQ